MPQNIFKIHDGRTNFWQWDTKQKLIVLDDRITEVRFSNRNMEHSKRRIVYKDNDGVRVCNVPDILLQLPKNLVAYACIKQDDGSVSTIKSVKFAVARQPIPADYICEQDAAVEAILDRIEILEDFIKDIETGNQELKKFDNMVDAAKWAKEEGAAGNIVVVYIEEDSKWVPHVVEADLSLSPICDCSGEAMNMGTYVPRLEHDKLIFELGTPTEEEIVIDIDKTNEWGSLDGSAEEFGGNYIWEPIV
jgi:hypothetical protein